ncbi:hypothetical protein MWG47_22225, partial [Escherichia coli]|nr:hypothetical protein [Escherichia coli]
KKKIVVSFAPASTINRTTHGGTGVKLKVTGEGKIGEMTLNSRQKEQSPIVSTPEIASPTARLVGYLFDRLSAHDGFRQWVIVMDGSPPQATRPSISSATMTAAERLREAASAVCSSDKHIA